MGHNDNRTSAEVSGEAKPSRAEVDVMPGKSAGGPLCACGRPAAAGQLPFSAPPEAWQAGNMHRMGTIAPAIVPAGHSVRGFFDVRCAQLQSPTRLPLIFVTTSLPPGMTVVILPS